MVDIDLSDKIDRFVAIKIAALIALIPVFLYRYAGFQWVEVLSVIISGLLTFALVLLYYNQSNILEEQKNIMARKYKSSLAMKGSAVANSDEVSIWLKNSGRGKVLVAYLKSEIVDDTGDIDIEYSRVSLKNEKGSYKIPPHSQFDEFTGEVHLRLVNSESGDSETHLPFRAISQLLSKQGISSVQLFLTLEIVDESGVEGEFSHELEIANQEINLKPPQIVTVDGEEKEIGEQTTLEEGIENEFDDQQDINKSRISEIADQIPDY